MQDLQTLRNEGKLSNREYMLLIGSSLEGCQVRMSAVKDPDGRYLFVFRSLTFQRQILKILEERSAHLTALLAASGGIVFSVQFEHGRFGQIEPGNGALAAKLGYSVEELTDLSFKELFLDPSRDDRDPGAVLAKAEKMVKHSGKASFRLSKCAVKLEGSGQSSSSFPPASMKWWLSLTSRRGKTQARESPAE